MLYLCALQENDTESNAGNSINSERQDVFSESQEKAPGESASSDDSRLHNNAAPVPFGDTSAGNDTDNKLSIITDDRCGNNTANDELCQQVVNDLCSNEETLSVDCNGNKSSEISTGADGISKVADVPATVERNNEEWGTGVRLNPEKVTETSDVVMVAAVPPVTDIPNDDVPPPLPTSVPPPSSTISLPDRDSVQELSLSTLSPETIITPHSPYANYDPINSPLAPEQSHIEQDTTDKHSSLSEEARLLFERLLTTTNERPPSASEITTAAEPTATENYCNNESEEKYPDLSESDRKLIKSTIASLGQRRPEVHNNTVSALPTRQSAEKDNKNACIDGAGNENACSTEMTTQESSQNKDEQQELDKKDMLKDVDGGAILTDKAKISERAGAADKLLVNTTSNQTNNAKACEFTPVTAGDSVNNRHENHEVSVVDILPGIMDATASRVEDPSSASRSISSANVPSGDVDVKGDFESRAISGRSESSPEPAVTVTSQVNVNEAAGRKKPSTAIDISSQSTDDVFRSGSSSSSVTAVPHSCDVESDALSKSRRTLLSDKAVSWILRDYYTEDVVTTEEQKPEKPEKKSKPAKPLIAQALLPKASRRPSGTLNSATAAALSSQTSSSFSNSKLGYSQVEIPRSIVLSEQSESQTAEDHQRPKPVIERDGNDAMHGDIATSRTSVSETVQASDMGVKKSTNSDEETADSRDVRTIAESRAFFKSRETAVKNSTDKFVSNQRNPASESSSAAATVNLTAATSVISPVTTSSSQVKAETSSKSTPPPETAGTVSTSQGELVVTSNLQTTGTTAAETTSTSTVSHSVTSTSSTSSLPALSEVPAEVPGITDSRAIGVNTGDRGGTTFTGRVPLSTRWTPKPFLLTTPVTKTTPTFVNFEPKVPTAKTAETAESDVPTNRSVELNAVVESTMPSASVENTPFNVSENIGVESSSSQPKTRWNSSMPTMTTTAGTVGSVDGSSVTDEEEWTSKSSDVGSTDVEDVSVTFQTGDPPVSATPTVAELKMRWNSSAVRRPSANGPSPLQKPVQNSSSVGLGRSFSMSHVEVQPKSEQAALANGCKLTSRGPSTPSKSWTEFDYRKTVLPTCTEASSSIVPTHDNRIASGGVEEEQEHINLATSIAFFQAAEQAEKQASNKSVGRKINKKPIPTSNIKSVADSKYNEQHSTSAEAVLSTLSDSSHSTHSTVVMTPGKYTCTLVFLEIFFRRAT